MAGRQVMTAALSIHKMEKFYETDYGLGLFKDTKMITEEQYIQMYDKCSKIRKLLIASITTAKKNQDNTGI